MINKLLPRIRNSVVYWIALYPVIFLYAQNIDRIAVSNILRPAAAVLLCAYVLHSAVRLFVKNRVRTQVAAGVILFLLFNYGHFVQNIAHFEIIRLPYLTVGKNTVFISITVLFILLFLFWIRRTKRECHRCLTFMAIFALGMMCMNAAYIGYYIFSSHINLVTMYIRNAGHVDTDSIALPDVYYIILDMHARADVLEKQYGYTDRLFTPALLQMGFYVATQSSANYPTTYESIASSLNMDYLDTLTGSGHPDVPTLVAYVENNAVAQNFTSLGYSYILFNSGYAIVNQSPFAGEIVEYSLGLSRFERLFLKTTIFARVVDRLNMDLNAYHRQRILSFFEKLKKIPDDPRPTFTFAHLVIPHWPFVFDADGHAVNQPVRNGMKNFPESKEAYRQQYINQLIFADKKMLEIVRTIQEKSPQPPVIIIQSDHGPSSEVDWNEMYDFEMETPPTHLISNEQMTERVGILNAYFFSDRDYRDLYATITPVNSFRVVFNHLFNISYHLLPDKPVGIQ